jgi:glutathione-specific gamma-glutamylcyclotransferase
MNDSELRDYWAQLPEIDPAIPRIAAGWVFAYGSLIWDPGFEYEERHRVTIHGYHRAFCIRSVRYRGTAADPGVVLGLDRGGSCQGVAYRLHDDQAADIIELIYRREMANEAYRPRRVPIRLVDGRLIQALTFVAHHRSPSYVKLDEVEVVRRLRQCAGARGQNCDYAINTLKALTEWGIKDSRLATIVRQLG